MQSLCSERGECTWKMHDFQWVCIIGATTEIRGLNGVNDRGEESSVLFSPPTIRESLGWMESPWFPIPRFIRGKKGFINVPPPFNAGSPNDYNCKIRHISYGMQLRGPEPAGIINQVSPRCIGRVPFLGRGLPFVYRWIETKLTRPCYKSSRRLVFSTATGSRLLTLILWNGIRQCVFMKVSGKNETLKGYSLAEWLKCQINIFWEWLQFSTTRK